MLSGSDKEGEMNPGFGVRSLTLAAVTASILFVAGSNRAVPQGQRPNIVMLMGRLRDERPKLEGLRHPSALSPSPMGDVALLAGPRTSSVKFPDCHSRCAA